MKALKQITDLFTAHGLKVTPQRIAVYRALEVLRHTCAEDIVREVHAESPSISVATIYNTLDCFTQNGLIALISTGNNKKYYDINPEPHHHLYCEDTHRLEDFRDPGLERMVREYISRQPVPGFELSDIKIQLVGTFK